MIEKKRLEELIEQGATIYYISEDYIKEIDFSKIVPNMLYYDGFNYYDKYDFNKDEILVFCEYEKLYEFETKEEAEWYLEFGSITRTEKLTLPTWNEISDGSIYDMTFIDNKKCKWQLNIDYAGISLIDLALFGRDKYWVKLTKENYIEACRLAKKLFLGKEVNI